MKKHLKILIALLFFIFLGAVLNWRFSGSTNSLPPIFQQKETALTSRSPTINPLPNIEVNNPVKTTVKEPAQQIQPVEIVAENLTIPWELAWLPSGELLVTQRPGQLLLINNLRQIIPIAEVSHIGEGGLLGMALHPQFENNNWIYLYLTTNSANGLTNRVERFKLIENQLTSAQIIIQDIPGARNHDGGRIAFGPDDKLYITTGDAGVAKYASDTNSLAGKILRLNDDGSIPSDNPFHNAVYSFGHRNPQGIVWDNQGRLWSTEHGRSGILSGFDELNLIQSGGNYGWPDSQGDEIKPGTIAPVLNSGQTITWAPAGMAYLNGSIFFGGLRGQALYQVTISDSDYKINTHFLKEFGRIRAVKIGPDGMIYISTSNLDGRGQKKAGDDKIIRLDSSQLDL